MTSRLSLAVGCVSFMLLACEPPRASPPEPTGEQIKQSLVQNFAAGSLIIPMDTTRQNAGMLRAYGLVHRLLRAGVPVHWAVLAGKASQANDFTVSLPATITNRETSAAVAVPVSYRGGPFIVSAADRALALPIIDAYLASDTVTVVHDVNGAFSADIVKSLTAAPRIAVFQDGAEAIAFADLNAAGIPDSAGNVWNGTSTDVLSESRIAGLTTTDHADGALFIAPGVPAYDHVTSMHYDATANTAEVVQEFRSWLASTPSAHAFMQCQAVLTFENTVGGAFITTNGVTDDSGLLGILGPPASGNRAADHQLNQWDGPLTMDTGNLQSLGLAGGSSFRANSRTLISDGTDVSQRIGWITGRMGGLTTNGEVTYLTGHDYGVDVPVTANPLTNGVRLLLNSLLDAPAGTPAGQPTVALTKSAPAITNGNSITFTLAYSNTGNAPATSAVLTDTLPTGLTFVSATGGGTAMGQQVTWTIGSIAAGANGSVSVTASVSADGTYANSATLAYRAGLTPRTATSNGTMTVRDVAPPVTSIVSGPPLASNQTSATFDFGSSEPGTFECQLDAAPAFTTCADPVTFTMLAAGPHTLRVRAVDAAGNVDATPEQHAWTIDLTPPAAPALTVPADASSTNDTTPTFSGTAETGTTVTVRVDGGVACTTTAVGGTFTCDATSALSAGAHSAIATASDAAGNTSMGSAPRAFTVDVTAPTAPAITTPAANGATNDTTPSFVGTAEPASTVTVRVDGTVACTATANGAGAWTCDAMTALSSGPHSAVATAADPAGNLSPGSAAVAFTIDLTAPGTPSLTTPTAGAITNDVTPTFAGTAEAGSTVTVRVDGGVACTTLASAQGLFTCDATSALSAGAHSATATAVDPAGNASPASGAVGFTVDTSTPGAPALTAPTTGAFVNDTTPTFSGTATPGSTVTVRVDGNVVCSGVAAMTTGAFSCESGAALSTGPHAAVATATSPGGTTSPPSSTVTFTIDTSAPSAPMLAQPADGAFTSDATPDFFGSAEAGSTVTVRVDGVVVCTVTADGGGSFTCAPATGLPEGLHEARAYATDAAGNGSLPSNLRHFTVDTEAPPSPSLLVPASGATSGLLPTFSGLSEAHAQITVRVDGSVACTTTADAFGRWACAAQTALTAGAHVATATATDAAMNASAASPQVAFTAANGQRPATPRITSPAADASVSTGTPTISGIAEPGSTVTVRVDGMVACTSTANASGAFGCAPSSPLTDGMHDLTAVASNTVGASLPSSPLGITVDTQAPAAPALTAPLAGATTGTTPSFAGTAEPLATVSVRVDGTAVCSATASAAGAFACQATTPLTTGAHTATAVASDRAQNTSPASAPVAFTVSGSAAPGAPTMSRPSAGAAVADTTPLLEGLATPGASVTVRIDGTVACTTTANGQGAWACVPGTPLAQGNHTATATATDANGTSPASAGVAFSVDTVAPSRPSISVPAPNALVGPSPSVQGTSDADTLVTVKVDGRTVCVTRASATGAFSCVVGTTLSDGMHSVTANAADAAGNRSADSTPVAFTVMAGLLPAAPTFTKPTPGLITNDGTPTFEGTAEPASTVTVRIDGGVGCTATASADGRWSCTPAMALPDGAHSASAEATNQAGTGPSSPSVAFTTDATAPNAPTFGSPTAGATVGEKPTFNGLAEPGTVVTVRVDGAVVCTATAAANGAWACSATSALAEGQHTASATARDAAGNDSAASIGVGFTVRRDDGLPAPPVIASPMQGATVMGPGVTVSGTAPAGGQVTIREGSSTLCTTTADAGGAFSCEATFSAGAHTIDGVTTQGGLTSRPGDAVTFTVEIATQPPGKVRLGGGGCSQTSGESLAVLGGVLVAWALARRRLRRSGLVAAVLVSAAASAQPASFELEHLTLNPGGQASLWLGTGDVLPQSDFRVALAAHYQHNPLVYIRDDLQQGALVGSRFGLHLTGAYGIFPWLEVGAQLPIIVFQTGEDLSNQGYFKAQTFSLGTPHLQARLGFLRERDGDPLDVAVQLGVGLPLGSAEAYAKDPSVSFLPRVGAGKAFGLFRAGLEVGASLKGAAVLSQSTTQVGDEIGSALTIGAAVTTTNQGLRGELSGRAFVPFTASPAGGEVLAGARFAFNDLVESFVLGGMGFGSAPGIPAFRVLAGVSIGGLMPDCRAGAPHDPTACPSLDLDADGVKNALDRCPKLKGPPALAGCPDTDGDEVEDSSDACPTQPGVPERRGCPVPDSDGDGIENVRDACPSERGVPERQGCPVKDADGDGLEDAKDACPADPGPAERRGCPVKDADGDGVEDQVDACPAEAGPPERKGCPIKDRDQDGVPDEVDNCPNEKGTADNQGCAKRQLVVITKEKLIIKDKIFFATGKSAILPKSFPLLEQVASVLNAHPEIKRVRVEGHTDNVGKDDANRTLSQARAEAVATFLSSKGVAPDRLVATGYGPDRPIDDNKTAAGRANNRRVDFVVEPPEGASP